MIQAVILARGRGTRQRPLTFTRPKPLLEIGGATILEHSLRALQGLVEEVILVVNPQDQSLFEGIGKHFPGMKIRCVQQAKPLGTGDSLKQAQPYIKERLLILNGDDLYPREDIKKILKRFPSILAQEVEDPSSFGAVFQKEGILQNLIEKPREGSNRLVNTGLYFLDRRVFEMKLTKSIRGEFELTEAIKALTKQIKIFVVEAENWIPLSYPWDLLKANQFLLQQQKGELGEDVVIEKGAILKGAIRIGKGTVIKSGSYLEGPLWLGEKNQIGPNTYLRPATMIGDHCRIGAGVEIKNSIIGSGSQVSHLSYIGDSVIGHHCHLGAGTIIANLRFDQRSIKSEVKGEMIDTGLRKWGAVLGDKVQTGVNVSIMPGVFIDPEITIEPNLVVKKNIRNPIFYD